MQIGLIVEGHGDGQAAPVLIRRIIFAVDPTLTVKFEVRRIPKSQLLRPGELERAIEALARQVGRQSRFLVLIDSDDDCPKDLAYVLNTRCNAAHSDVAISVVVANGEYEAWFLASIKSLAGFRGLNENLEPPPDAESVRGAKEWLTAHMSGQSYSETRHQAAYSALMDLSKARLARSYRKLEKEVVNLLHEAH